jgi:hypothetical protein
MASIGLLGLIASSADAKGSKRPKQPPLKNIATTANPKCDVKNIKFLEGMIKKGSAVKLQKKDLDSARYRYSIAKRALAEKEFALCIAAIKSSQRVLSNARPIPAKPTRGSTSYCTNQDMKTLAETIALGDKYMFPAKALFSAEAKLAKAKKASSSRQRRSCGWNVKTGIDALEPHRKALEAKKARIAAAVKACGKKKNNRGYKSCRNRARGKISPSCTSDDLKFLWNRITSGQKQKFDKIVIENAKKHFRNARKAMPARNWAVCLHSLKSGNAIITNVFDKRARAGRMQNSKTGHCTKDHLAVLGEYIGYARRVGVSTQNIASANKNFASAKRHLSSAQKSLQLRAERRKRVASCSKHIGRSTDLIKQAIKAKTGKNARL